MQRQSLGSPSRERLVISAAADDVVSRSEDRNRRDSSPSSFSASAAVDDELKPEKRLRLNIQSEKFIHFIPVLIVFCFLVLYFSAHDPSPQELAHFRGMKNYKHIDEIIETNDIINNNNDNNKQLKRSGAFVMRSQRNLQEEIIQKDSPKAQSHRKLGDF
ncbi:hypothetical protein RND81_06G215800 [Saponaria officinalis]|uniref:Transmembrane protein n=1 Tax=Saponaria officinalis TaxID=3572 RepID=A0AAW1KDN7_SAPOF